MSNDVNVVYIYFETETGTPYYYNPTTGETSYELDPQMVVYDPNTQQPYEVPKHKKKRRKSQKRRKLSGKDDAESPRDSDDGEKAPEDTEKATEDTEKATEDAEKVTPSPQDIEAPDDIGALLDVSEQVTHFDEAAVQREKDHPAAKPESIFPCEEGGVPYLPSDVKEDIAKFQVREYAQKYFKQRRGNHKFSRKRIDISALTEFSAEPIEDPLLDVHDKKTGSLAVQCFKWILNYTGVEKEKNASAYADKIVNACYAHPILRDEVMFQLIKQTRNNPLPDCLTRTWELFLIIVTYFPSTKNSEVWIKSHFSREFHNPDENIASIAQFCYIRFSARCAVGKVLETTDIGYTQKIPTEYKTGHRQFGASIYEQLWNQRRSVRKLPFPYIVHHMAEQLLKKNAEEKEGIFRLAGELKHVDEMAVATNLGRDVVSAAPINDVASLFKKWFRDLPDPIVSVELTDLLLDVYEEKSYLSFVEKLPRAHKLTLMYLIGFLQRLEKAKDKTRMTAKNLSIVFGPNILRPIGVTEPEQIKLFTDMSMEFMLELINNWDTSAIYPLDMAFVQE